MWNKQKYHSLTILALYAFALSALAFNGKAHSNIASDIQLEIYDIQLQNDSINHCLNVQYALKSPPGAPLTVSLKIYRPDGSQLCIDAADVTGDIGYPVFNGPGKTVRWHYGVTVAKGNFMVKIIAYSGALPNLNDLIKQVDSNRLKDFLSHIYGVRNYRTGKKKLERTKAYIADVYTRLHLTPQMQKVPFNGYAGTNIIGHLPGKVNPKKHFLITAHFDTVKESPGANDNGSGVAGLLEAAAVLAAHHFDHSIDFIAFDLEEENGAGSAAYLSSLHADSIEIAGVLNLDMIGAYSNLPGSQLIPEEILPYFPGLIDTLLADSAKGNFVLVISNKASEPLADEFAASVASHVPQLRQLTLVAPAGKEFEIEGMSSSDHAKFWEKNYHALHIGVGGPTRDRYYHSKNDKLSNINYTFISKVVKACIVSLCKLAKIENPVSSTAAIQL